MKYCEHCGAELNEDSVVCIKCGRSVKHETAKNNSNNTLLTVAKVFMIISCVASPTIGILYSLFLLLMSVATTMLPMIALVILLLIIFCLPLAWTIPMTVSVSRKIKENEPIGMTLKICTLIFVNLIAGILLLCVNDD